MKIRGTAGLLAAIVIVGALPAVARAETPTIWMSPPDAFSLGPAHWRDARPDFLEMFAPDAPWTTAAKKVTVYKVSPGLVDYAPDEVLRLIFSDLQRRGIALAWEMGAVPPGAGCGTGTEGYAGNTDRSVRRIKAAGGQLRFVAMDEPFWYGHYADTPHSCRMSLAALAHGVAERMDVVRAVFPNVEVGDIEPVGNPPDNGYTNKLIEWAQAFRDATGKPLAFIHADVNWNGIWRKQLPQLLSAAKKLNIPAGVIINGDAKAGSNEEWCDAAIDHEQQVVDIAGVQPDQLIFQSWDHLPTRILPEQTRGTMMNLVLDGTRSPAHVSLLAKDGAINGRVTDPSGKPVANTKVEISARDIDGIGGMHEVKLRGVVPPEAHTAIFALRVGVECDCSGPIDVSVGGITFDNGDNDVVHRSFQQGSEPFTVKGADKKLSVNTPSFPVQAGRPYSIVVPMRVREQLNRPGYLGLIFFNSKGGEVRRDPIEFRARNEAVGSSITDANGTFRLPPAGRSDPAKLILRAQVAGTDVTRPTRRETTPQVN